VLYVILYICNGLHKSIAYVWINHDNDLVDLTITHTIKHGKGTKAVSEVIHTNKKHPFLTVEKRLLVGVDDTQNLLARVW
jgi:hypothetical protein